MAENLESDGFCCAKPTDEDLAEAQAEYEASNAGNTGCCPEADKKVNQEPDFETGPFEDPYLLPPTVSKDQVIAIIRAAFYRQPKELTRLVGMFAAYPLIADLANAFGVGAQEFLQQCKGKETSTTDRTSGCGCYADGRPCDVHDVDADGHVS